MFDQKSLQDLLSLSISHVEDLIIWLDHNFHLIYTNRFELTQAPLFSRDGKAVTPDQFITFYNEETWLSVSQKAVERECYLFDGELNLSIFEELLQTPTQLSHDYLFHQASHNRPQRSRFTLRQTQLDGHDFFILVCRDQTAETGEIVALERADDLTKTMKQLERANAELAQAAQAKDEFLASMSHELRTPLNAVLGICEALLEGVYGRLESDQHEPIRQIFSNGHHLLSVISDILDLSKLRAGGISLSLSDIDVEACCFEALQVFRAEMQKKRLAINVSIEGVYLLNADERWFKQVLMNLLSNAVKFTESDHRVGIIVKESPRIGYLRVTVWDEGIGISEENIPKLFQTFVQLDTSLARAYEGTGLGLSIVASVMQLHGGTVSVESQEKIGSQFHLDFPWLPDKQTLDTHDTYPLTNEIDSVLIIEDSQLDADRMTRFLSELDAKVLWDNRGNKMIELAYQHQPDIIILDLFLPEISGWELLKKLKSDPYLCHIPVVICSVLDRDEHRPEMKLVSAYLQKPYSRSALHSSIQKASKPKTSSQSKPPKALYVSAQEGADKTVLEPKQPINETSTRSVAPVAQQPKILIVDDNLSNIQLVNDYLSRKGYFIMTAEDGYQAVQVARAQLPDLILMDIQMPHMDGIEATSHIKADPRVSHIPVFALTALAMPGDRERCLNAGMDDYFTKPVSLRGLHKRIKEKLKS